MAALDFPDTPTVGQLYGSSGTVWRWDGARWASTAGASGTRGTMAYAEMTTVQSSISTLVDIVGLTVTFNAVAGRRYKVTGSIMAQTSVAGDAGQLSIVNGAGNIGSFRHTSLHSAAVNYALDIDWVFVSGVTGSLTYKLQYQKAAGTGVHAVWAAANAPAFIMVEDITYEAGTSGTPGSSLTGLESQRPGGSAGSTYFATDTKRQFVHDGTGWIIMLEPQQAFTPFWYGFTVSGANSGAYQRSNGWVEIVAKMNVQPGAAHTGVMAMALPFQSADIIDLYTMNFRAYTNNGSYQGGVGGGITTQANLYLYGATANYSNLTPMSIGVPEVIAVGNNYYLSGRYQMANRYS